MNNYENYIPNDDTELRGERDELIDQYLNYRDTPYDELVAQLEEQGGRLLFHDSEQLAKIPAAFTTGVTVAFSERQFPGGYQSGTLTEDTFLVPLANIDRPQNIYRPQLCATIQDSHGMVDTLLFPIRKHSDGKLEVTGIRLL